MQPIKPPSAIAIKKPGIKSRIDKLLSEAQKEELFNWLTKEEFTYAQATAKAKESFGLTLNATNLSNFWQHYCSPRLENQRSAGRVLLEVLIKVEPDNTICLSVVQGSNLTVPAEPKPIS